MNDDEIVAWETDEGEIVKRKERFDRIAISAGWTPLIRKTEAEE